MKKIVWVTGSCGFIGRFVSSHFAKEGCIVFGIGHGKWVPGEAFKYGISFFVNGDINSSGLRELALESGKPDVIIHLAGGASVSMSIDNPQEDFSKTVESTLQLMEWVRLNSKNTKIVSVSSAAVYGIGHNGLISEDAQLKPCSPYGHHKLMMEEICRVYGQIYGIQSVISRLFSVYGTQLRKQLLWDLCNKLSSNPNIIELSGTGEELRDWIHIEDVTRALFLLSNYATDESPIFNIGSGKASSVRNIATTLLDQWSSDAEIIFSGESRRGDPDSLVASPHKIQNLGFKCNKSIYDGISEYVSWYLSGHVD